MWLLLTLAWARSEPCAGPGLCASFAEEAAVPGRVGPLGVLRRLTARGLAPFPHARPALPRAPAPRAVEPADLLRCDEASDGCVLDAADRTTPAALDPRRMEQAARAWDAERTDDVEEGCAVTTLGDLAIYECAAKYSNPSQGYDSTGSRIWDAGRVMAELLSGGDACSVRTSFCESVPVKDARVLELGSGTGIGGLAAAAGGARAVVMTDGRAAALPLLEANADANGFGDTVHAAQLEWGSRDDRERIQELGPFDLVIGSDLLYAPESHPELLATLEHLVGNDTEVLLCYPRRFTEDLFFELCEQSGFKVLAEEEPELGIFARRMRRPAQRTAAPRTKIVQGEPASRVVPVVDAGAGEGLRAAPRTKVVQGEPAGRVEGRVVPTVDPSARLRAARAAHAAALADVAARRADVAAAEAASKAARASRAGEAEALREAYAARVAVEQALKTEATAKGALLRAERS